MVKPLLFMSFRAVRLKVSSSRPLFFVPWDVHLRVTLGRELGACARHNQAIVIVWMVCDILVIPVLFNSFKKEAYRIPKSYIMLFYMKMSRNFQCRNVCIANSLLLLKWPKIKISIIICQFLRFIFY